jgi:hypothetical protein
MLVEEKTREEILETARHAGWNEGRILQNAKD